MQLNVILYCCYSVQSSLHFFKLFCNILGLSNYYKIILHLTYKCMSRYANKDSIISCYNAGLCSWIPNSTNLPNTAMNCFGVFFWLYLPCFCCVSGTLLFHWFRVFLWKACQCNGNWNNNYSTFALVRCWRYTLGTAILQGVLRLAWMVPLSTQSVANTGYGWVRATPKHCPDARVHN